MISSHGTFSRYLGGPCRCQPCRDAWAAYQARRKAGAYATKSELAEWMRGLGWDKRIPSGIPTVFIERWNREHPERPYVGEGTGRR